MASGPVFLPLVESSSSGSSSEGEDGEDRWVRGFSQHKPNFGESKIKLFISSIDQNFV